MDPQPLGAGNTTDSLLSMQGVRSAFLPVITMLLAKAENPSSAKQSAKGHWLRRFALLLALTPPVRTPGLDPAGANGGPLPSL